MLKEGLYTTLHETLEDEGSQRHFSKCLCDGIQSNMVDGLIFSFARFGLLLEVDVCFVRLSY